jgi:hypothetical protein
MAASYYDNDLQKKDEKVIRLAALGYQLVTHGLLVPLFIRQVH